MTATMQAEPKLPFRKKSDRDVYRAAQKAVRGHIAAMKKLTRLGVLRSHRAVQSDFAEWIASRVLNLKLSSNAVQESYDATDSRRKKYEIKGRVTSSLERATSFDFRKKPKGFDFLVSIFFDGQYRVLGITKIPRSVVVTLGSQTRSRFSFRWNRRTRSDPRIVWVVRPRNDAA